MKEINLILNVDEANLILEGLGQMPYVKVYELVVKVQSQAQAQISEEKEPDENTMDSVETGSNDNVVDVKKPVAAA